MLERFRQSFCCWLLSVSGAVAITFGFMLPLIVGSAGMAVDLSKAYLVKNRLCQALDAAALAVSTSTGDRQALEDLLNAYIQANHNPSDNLGQIHSVSLDMNGEVIKAEASADVITHFMGVLGNDDITVYCTTEVIREVRGLEVVMVVDNTGSMSSNNNIEALRVAAANFVNILFDRTTDEDSVKIGIVPYVATVNVGPYGLGLDEDGFFYDTPFVNNPLVLDFDQSDFNAWHGCVLARENPDDTMDAPDNTWRWDMWRHDFSRSSNYSWRENAAWYNYNYGPNYDCNRNYIQPLTSDRLQLLDKIDDFYASGYTHGNAGMVWGYRVLSPGFPFREGSAWEDEEWQKAVLMMTDGINTVPPSYGAYGGYLDYVAEGIGTNELNRRFEDVCNRLREEGVLVYTITFTSGVNATTRGYYERCATQPSNYYNAPSQADLIQAFERISTELANIHISR